MIWATQFHNNNSKWYHLSTSVAFSIGSEASRQKGLFSRVYSASCSWRQWQDITTIMSIKNIEKVAMRNMMRNEEYLVKLIDGCCGKEIGAQPTLRLGCRNLLGGGSGHTGWNQVISEYQLASITTSNSCNLTMIKSKPSEEHLAKMKSGWDGDPQGHTWSLQGLREL